jgi:hypothetical protein
VATKNCMRYIIAGLIQSFNGSSSVTVSRRYLYMLANQPPPHKNNRWLIHTFHCSSLLNSSLVSNPPPPPSFSLGNEGSFHFGTEIIYPSSQNISFLLYIYTELNETTMMVTKQTFLVLSLSLLLTMDVTSYLLHLISYGTRWGSCFTDGLKSLLNDFIGF